MEYFLQLIIVHSFLYVTYQQYSLVLNRRHAVFVDTANFKGPKLCQLFDSATEILLIGSINTTEQINLIFINIF